MKLSRLGFALQAKSTSIALFDRITIFLAHFFSSSNNFINGTSIQAETISWKFLIAKIYFHSLYVCVNSWRHSRKRYFFVIFNSAKFACPSSLKLYFYCVYIQSLTTWKLNFLTFGIFLYFKMTSLIFTTLTELSELLASYHIQNITTCTEGKIYCTLYAYAYDILPLLASKTNFFFKSCAIFT